MLGDKAPYLEIKNNVVSGSNGCNRIMGALEEFDIYTFQLGQIAGTKMMCPDMRILISLIKPYLRLVTILLMEIF